ncbi:hypothetical protein BDR22DRAFT_800760, partial [Usnea florida]
EFDLYFNNAQELVKTETGPYFNLPELESIIEACLWNVVFSLVQDFIGIPRGPI